MPNASVAAGPEALRVGVVGAGAWGTALALTAQRAGNEVILWARDRAHAHAMAQACENPRFLPGVRLPADLTITAELQDLAAVEVVLLAVPAQAVRQAALALAPVLGHAVRAVVCAKGIERDTSLWLSQVLAACLPHCTPAVLSGPSFAVDVAAGLPTAVVLASPSEAEAGGLAAALGSPSFRIYRSDDMRGVEIGAAAKNVLAIASGIAAGRGLGASAQAALVARSFTELVRFGRAHGARAETLTGLSGLGDLVLTCNSAQSRNFSLGIALGQGHPGVIDGPLAEGAFTAAALVKLADESGIDMPIASSVAAVLAGRIGVEQAIDDLLRRPLKAEL